MTFEELVDAFWKKIEFRISIHCIVTPELDIPAHVMASYPIGSDITFIVDKKNGCGLWLDDGFLSFKAMFGKMLHTVRIPIESIFVVTYDNNIIIENFRNPGIVKTEPEQIPRKWIPKIVSSNKVSRGKRKIGNLKLVYIEK